MKFKDRLKNVFQETFLDLFHDDAPEPRTLDAALEQARQGLEGATDAFAAFSVTHLHLSEEHRAVSEQLGAVQAELERALAEGQDDLAREQIRKRQALQKELEPLEARLETSRARHDELKGRVGAMKAQVLEIERKKLDLQLRDRAADAVGLLNETEAAVGRAHDASACSDTEADVALKESANQVAEDQRNTVDSRLDRLIEEDEVEQELARLKQERSKAN